MQQNLKKLVKEGDGVAEAGCARRFLQKIYSPTSGRAGILPSETREE
jgi:hypothetical protein